MNEAPASEKCSAHHLDGRLNQLGDFFVEGGEAGGELEVVHGFFGFEHAAGDGIDLAGDEVGLLAVDG
jgi:hypothetical protein